MAFEHYSHQLYLKTRVEDQSKYICADCEEDLLKCAGRIAHAKVCVHVCSGDSRLNIQGRPMT